MWGRISNSLYFEWACEWAIDLKALDFQTSEVKADMDYSEFKDNQS